ncbi:hypothetical protein PMCN03_0091 [Pasteurella multocida subsp. multocida str. HB03]|nr:hypothetical protein NT08PM_0157 [Pasteurella multocida subsp. multocida str. 3480]AHE63561.1 hypothetical protein PMCN03_0091 [Pasteurella multocida subsp. multocida str. HB03]
MVDVAVADVKIITLNKKYVILVTFNALIYDNRRMNLLH